MILFKLSKKEESTYLIIYNFLLITNAFHSISIRFNVNHTVDTPVNVEENEIGELKSQPAFKVDMLRGDTTLSLMCSFTGQEEEANGLYIITIICNIFIMLENYFR